VEHIFRAGHQIREDWVWREQAFRQGQIAEPEELIKPRVVVCDLAGELHGELSRYVHDVELVNAGDLDEVARDLQEAPAHAVIVNASSRERLWDAVEWLGSKEPNTPIVGCSIPRPMQRAIAAGALGHLIKPVKRTDLMEAIESTGMPVRRILVVDDDSEALALMARILRAIDPSLEITTASSGERALDECRRARPDLILLDIVMPDMDGWQVLEALRGARQSEEVPAFFLSAQDVVEQSAQTAIFLAALGEGVPLTKLFRCSLELSAQLRKP
jgi:CheY-like chemotaxis protein